MGRDYIGVAIATQGSLPHELLPFSSMNIKELKGTSKKPSFPRMRESKVLIDVDSRIRESDEVRVFRSPLK